MSLHSLRNCMVTIIGDSKNTDFFAECGGVDAEMRALKKQYSRMALTHHPDKGGDPAKFRDLFAAFKAVRAKFNQKSWRGTFTSIWNSKTKAPARRRQNDESDSDDDYEPDEDRKSSSSSARRRQPGKKSSGVDPDDEDMGYEYEEAWKEYGDMPPPSYEFFQHAAEEEMPTYHVEPAKSSRSKCTSKSKSMGDCGQLINKGTLRCGVLDSQSGSYIWWKHLRCWRIPSKIWLGLPDPAVHTDRALFHDALDAMNHVFFSGFRNLTQAQQEEVVDHVMDKGHWARLSGGKNRLSNKTKTQASSSSSSSSASASLPVPVIDLTHSSSGNINQQGARAATSTAMTISSSSSSSSSSMPKPKKYKVSATPAFVPARPGVGKAKHGALKGHTIVLTGLFPEIGGGSGLNLGKDRVKNLIGVFGGKCTSSVSGRTTLLVVGKSPGLSKVSKGRAQPKCNLLDLKQLNDYLNGEASLPGSEDRFLIKGGFSAGYTYRNGISNSLAYHASPQMLSMARAGPARIAQPQPAPTYNASSTSSSSSSSSVPKPKAKPKPAPKAKTAKKPAAKKRKQPTTSQKKTKTASKKASTTKQKKVKPNPSSSSSTSKTKSSTAMVIVQADNMPVRRSTRTRRPNTRLSSLQ